MNRLRETRQLIFLTCLLTATAIFLIYSSKSKSVTDAETEEQRKQLTVSAEDPYTASRGEYDRLAESKPEPQATPAAVKPAVPAEVKPAAPAAKPAAPEPKPAAPAAKPKAAPVKAVAKPESQSGGDVDVLARLIMAEAQGEPYEAKVAVGAVVINRVQSGRWADTVKEVIYQKSGGYYQFTPVQNGWINKPADAECIRAAKAALSGADPTNGAQFYYDDKVTNEWILAKPVSTQIGHMTYAY